MLPRMDPLDLHWNPFDQLDPGPLIDIVISATDETIAAGQSLGWEYPKAQAIKALIDTGSPFTIVNRVFARNRKLPQTNAGIRIKTLGGPHLCDEHSCTISIPGTCLPRIETIRILAGDFDREPFHACILGRDAIRHWTIRLDGRNKRVSVSA